MASKIKEPKVGKRCAGPNCNKTLKPIDGYGSGFEDAFCSTVCCKAYFGVETSTSSGSVGVK